MSDGVAIEKLKWEAKTDLNSMPCLYIIGIYAYM